RSKAEETRAVEAAEAAELDVETAEARAALAAAAPATATTTRRPGLFRGALEIARAEARELRSQPGLYLFVPLILLQTIGVGMVRVGPFDTPLLATAGTLAAQSFNTLMLLVALLLLFYTVESLEREKAKGLAPIHHSTPIGSG